VIEKILKFADEYEMLPASATIIVCVSGGADSMCLLKALMQISDERDLKLAVAHFNHNLRGAESDADETFVRKFCLSNDIAYHCGAGDVRLYAKQNGLSIEVAARDLRYAFFYELAKTIDAEQIATAHTADDNAETIIINLTRGAGGSGLSGIPPVRGKVIRPMLKMTRDEVIQFLAEHAVAFVEDSTNLTDVYTRNKIRHLVIPILREINPRFNEALMTTAKLMRADEEVLLQRADEFITKDKHAHKMCNIKSDIEDKQSGILKNVGTGRSVNCAELLKLPFAVSSRVIRRLYGGNLAFRHVQACLALCQNKNPSAKLSLKAMTVYRAYDRIVFEPASCSGAQGFTPIFPTDGCSALISEAGLKISGATVTYNEESANINKTFTSFLFKTIDIYGKITVRPRREGDKIRLTGQDGTKTLKKLFIERRIPAGKRASIPVIADDKGVLAVYGLGMGDRAVPMSGDTALQIDFEKL